MGRRGDSALLCNRDNEVKIVNYSHHHIHAKVLDPDINSSRFLVGFYSNPDSSKRHQLWSLLSITNLEGGGPWCMIRDFNEILTQDEKSGGNSRPAR